MNYPVQAENIGFLRLIIEAMRPFAAAPSVALAVEARESALIAHYHPRGERFGFGPPKNATASTSKLTL